MTDNQLRTVLVAFGIDGDAEISPIHDRVWVVNGEYVLKKGSRAALESSTAVSRHLLRTGIPVAACLVSATGEAIVQNGDACYGLMHKLKGEHLDPHHGDCTDNGRILGRAVAALHVALGNMDLPVEPHDVDTVKELSDWMIPEFDNKQLVFEDGVIEACLHFKKVYETLPRQLIHRDMHLGNLLFRDGQLSGYLDFDLSQANVRLFDICYLGASMLANDYRDPDRLSRWRRIFTGVVDGYEQISPLTLNEKQAIPLMFMLIEVLFTAYFSKMDQTEIAQSCAHMVNWLFRNQALVGVDGIR